MTQSIIIGIAGASGSGKTLVAKQLRDYLGASNATIICVDSYYRCLEHLPLAERLNSNFDHPNALDLPQFFADLHKLKHGKEITVPAFEYSTCIRKPGGTLVQPKPIIIVEGILLLAMKELLPLLDLKIYIECPLDLAILRRICRDIVERGDTVERAAKVYRSKVRPMFFEFVAPSKYVADIVIYNPDDNFDIDLSKIKEKLAHLMVTNKSYS